MSDKINPTGSQSQTAVDLIPKFYQSPDNVKFIQSTIDQLVQKGTTRKINGYIGRRNSKSVKGNDVFVNAADQTRQNYQLEPSILVKDKIGNNVFFKDYIDYINQLNVFGGNTTNHERINRQEFYSWDPHIDWDKFVNFQQYYWLPYGPEAITIYGQQKETVSSYNVAIEIALSSKSYVFTPNGLIRDPVIKLYRGQTYKFNIDSPGEPFSIKTTRTLGTQDRYIDVTQSVDNFGVMKGVVTFTVPVDAPDVLYYVSERDNNLGGMFQIFDIDENSFIDVSNDFLGKQTYSLPDGTLISNGMKVAFGGNVTPEIYATGEYYVEGVGSAITLVSTSVLEVIAPYTNVKSVNFDEDPFDLYPFDEASTYALYKDYILVNRGSKDRSAWSRYNRWFHKDVIDASARLNGTVADIDQTARATRPIIEFESGLRLFNFGNYAISDVDLVDNYTIDAFSTIEGKSGYNVDGIQLTEGMRIIFLNDQDPLVANRVYVVHFINIENTGIGVPQIHLDPAETPETDNTVLVKQGQKYQGYMFWFNGSTWEYGQQKNAVNQSPLFDLVNEQKVKFSNYPGSTFAGTKIFSYKEGTTGINDPVLGFPLSYQNINNIGDIKFEFNLLTDTFEYKNLDGVITGYSNIGFLEKLNYTNSIEYCNGWKTSLVTHYQPAVRIYKNSNKVNNFELDVYNNKLDLNDLELRVYINGIRLDRANWSILDAANYKVVNLKTDVSTNDVVTLKSFAKQPINSNGYYELPINLQNNPLNEDVTIFTLGEVADHVNSIIDNLQTKFIGSFPGTNNLRDIGNITPYGTKFVQHSSPGSLSVYHITSEANNVVKSLEKARDDYGKFKRNFIALSEKMTVQGDVVSQVDAILKKLTLNKAKLAPYYFSDMVPFGAKKISEFKVVDPRIKTYPLILNTTFNQHVLSNKAVNVYIAGNQLLYGKDYTFTTDGYINIIAPLVLKQTITVLEYDNTDGCYIPATPTKLGLWPKYTPKIYLDTSFVTPVKMIQGHDGSIVLAYNDYRDELILELEKRIYNNISAIYDSTIFDIVSMLPGYSRETEYSLSEVNRVLSSSFYNWITLVGEDFTKTVGFDRSNAFTYNYSGHSAPDGRSVPGYWRGIYRWMYDTERPHLFPWEMLGFTEEPQWWATTYGSAPYTSDNIVMWTDISNGMIKEPGKATEYRPKYAKPFLLNHLPVDESGVLINPIRSNVALGANTADIALNYVFGDGSPAESAWRKSSYYPFSVISAFMILKPAQVFGASLDTSRTTRNLANQLVNSVTMLRVRPSDIAIPSIYSTDVRVQTSGIINYLVDDLVHDNLTFYTNYQYNLKNMNVQLSYRIGSFTTKDNFNLLLDSKNPAATGSLFVPPENYSIVYNSSSPVKKISYSGVIITKVDSGYEIKGYSLTDPYFNYYPWLQGTTGINVGGISSPYVLWAQNQFYNVGQIVSYNGIYYRTIANTNSGDTFNQTSFQKLQYLPVSGGVNANFRKIWDRDTVIAVPYGTVFPEVQAVVDFLTGYGEYLKDQGFIFDDFNDKLDAVSNWDTSAKEFMFWTTQNWSTNPDYIDWTPDKLIPSGTIVKYNGEYYKAVSVQSASAVFIAGDYAKIQDINSTGNAVISLSPAASKLTFTATMAVVDDISNSFNNYEMFKVDGTTLHPAELDSVRQGNTISYIPRDNNSIYNASFYLVQKEQVIVLDNTTMFNDVIYNPASGYRQERIKVGGFVASQWFGGFEIPGFIYDRADIQTWEPFTDYHVGDIVKQGQYYLQATPTAGIIQGSATLDSTQWQILPAKPQPRLLPNWSYKASQFQDFYDLDDDNFDTGQQKIAQHLIGYQDRQYLDNIIQDKVSEFKFYQGMIREKGTQNSLNKLFDVLSSEDKESVLFFEEWAIRVGQYGASSGFENIEFTIDETGSVRNPQGFHLIQKPEQAEIASNFNVSILPGEVYLPPVGYNSNPFPVSANFTPFLRSGGYVQLGEDVIQLSTIDSIVDQDIKSFKDGTFIWTPFYKNSWNIYRFTNSNYKVMDVTDNGNGSLNVYFEVAVKNIEPDEYIGISQVGFAGFYKVLNVASNYITIDATNIKSFKTPFTLQSQIVVFFLLPAKTDHIDNANNLIKYYTTAGDKMWTDDNGSGHWATWQLNPVYTKGEIVNQDNTIGVFKYAVNWTPNTSYKLGTIVSYNNSYYYTVRWHTSGATFSSNVTLLSYGLNNAGQTITNSTNNQANSLAIRSITPDTLSSFGQAVAVNKEGTLAIVYTGKDHIATYRKSGGATPWILQQVISQPFIANTGPLNTNPNKPVTFGETLAISPNSTWLVVGSPKAGQPSTIVDSATGNTICSAGSNLVIPTLSVQLETGVISLYKNDSYGNYNLLFTLVTGNDVSYEHFGSTIALGNTVIFARAQAADGNSKVYQIKLVNNTWVLNHTAFTDPIYSTDFGKSIVISEDDAVVAISSPSSGKVFVYKKTAQGNYVLSQTITDPSILSSLTAFRLTVLDGGYGFKNVITDVYDNLLQNITTINGTGNGLTFNLGVDTSGVVQSSLIQNNGTGYQSGDVVTVVNPLGVGGVLTANIVSGGTNYVDATNVSVGYQPAIVTVATGLVSQEVFIPTSTPNGTLKSGMALRGTGVPAGLTIGSVESATISGVTISGIDGRISFSTYMDPGNPIATRKIAIGMVLTGGGVAANTYVSYADDANNWYVSPPQSVTNVTVTGTRYLLTDTYGSQVSGSLTTDSLTATAVIEADANGTTSTLSLTDFPSIPFELGTRIIGTGTGIATVNNPLGNKAVGSTVISTTGVVKGIDADSGSGPLGTATTFTNLTGTAPAYAATGTQYNTFVLDTVSSINGTTLTINTVTSGTVGIGYVLTGTGIVEGTYIVAPINGPGVGQAGNGTTWLVSQSQIKLTNTGPITGTLNAIIVPSPIASNIAVGSSISFGTAVGGLSTSTVYYVTKIIDTTRFSVGASLYAVADTTVSTATGRSILTINNSVVAITKTYLNIPVRSNLVGSGSGAVFNVAKVGSSTNYADSGQVVISLVTPGTGYKIGDRLILNGALLGGLADIHDLTFTISDGLNASLDIRLTGMVPFNSADLPIGTAITATDLVGKLYQGAATTVTVKAWLDNSASPQLTNTPGTYTGIVYTIPPGTTIPVPGTIGDISTDTVAPVTYSGVTQLESSGTGVEAIVDVTLYSANKSYATVYTKTYTASGSSGTTLKVSNTTSLFAGMRITGTGFVSDQTIVTVKDSTTLIISASPDSTPAGTLTFSVIKITIVNQGGLYTVGDTLTISGAVLGGDTPLNDLQLTVATNPTVISGTLVTANVTPTTTWTINANLNAGNTNYPITLTAQQTKLNVSAVTLGELAVGQVISGTGITPGTKIVAGSGNTWYLDKDSAAPDLTSITAALPTTSVIANSTGTPGNGLTVDIKTTAGVITKVTINNQGANYNATDKLVIIGGNNDAVIIPQSVTTLGTMGLGTIKALANGVLQFSKPQTAGTFYVGQRIQIHGGTNTALVDGWTPSFSNTILDATTILPVSMIIAGATYKIASLGNTNFTAIGGDSTPAVGQIFVATYSPSTGIVPNGFVNGTGTVSKVLNNAPNPVDLYITKVENTSASSLANPDILDYFTQITISLIPNGSPIRTTVNGTLTNRTIASPIFNDVITDPVVVTVYYPNITRNAKVQLTTVYTSQTNSLNFGGSLSIASSSNYLAIGSNLYTSSYTHQGKVDIYKNINSQYVMYQELVSPRPIPGELFGSKIAFMNNYDTVVVYSAGANSSLNSVFDTDTTTFDLGATTISDITPANGRVDVFDQYNTNWICGESLETNHNAIDGYGQGFAVANNKIIIGVPNALDGTENLPAGKVYTYEKNSGKYSWTSIRKQIDTPDLRKIKKVFLYNKSTSQLITHLDVIDPYYGKIAGSADQEITFKSFYDPAIYTYYNTTLYNENTLPVNVDEGQAWNTKQIGKLWWDLRTAKFVDNHTDDLIYRNSTLNTLVDGASIDVYEWVETTMLPSAWARQADTADGLTLGISGQPLYGDNIYSIKQTYDPFTNSFENTYYFWVKNPSITPALETRKISANSVSKLIANPRGEGYQFLSITGTDSFSLSNIQPLLKDKDIVLSIEYWTIDNTEQNVHSQWKLISNDPTTILPASIEQKWFDSLCGKDATERVVPDFSLPPKLRYGTENRPRQGMFVNRYEALKQFIEQANLVLLQHQIVEEKDISNLSSYDTEPPAVSGLYDTAQDTDAELSYVSTNYIKTPILTPIIVDGIITGVNIVFAGAGYLVAPAVTITGPGVGAKLSVTINASGQITKATIITGGKGYIDGKTTLTVRPFSVLVHSDSVASDHWSIYGYNPDTKSWTRSSTQSYDVREFWTKVDWYGTHTNSVTGITQSYNQYSIIDYAVDTYSELQSINPEVGQTVKVRTTGSGGWQLLRRSAISASIDWTQNYQIVGIENGTIQLSSGLYNFSTNSVGYDGFLYDDNGYDYSALKELRIILNTLKDNIFTGKQKEHYLELFFGSLRYAFSEQTYIDWAFKTSFVKAQHNLGKLRQTVTYTNDNLVNFEEYISEVTPYRTTVREFIDDYDTLDTSTSMITDFDLPPSYESTGNRVIETTVSNGTIVANNSDLLSLYPWKHWIDNLGYKVTSIAIIDGGAGYITPPVVTLVGTSGKGATAKAFIANGKVNQILITSEGTGYFEAPKVVLNGGLPHKVGTVARAVAIIGDSVTRSSLIKIKFDRTSQQYFVIQLDKSETFTGSGNKVQFELMWAPDIKIGQSTVTINNVLQLRETYTLTIKKTTTYGYTSYTGLITFVNPPKVDSTIVVNYVKDIALLNAQDRIQFYYDPGVGALGKDLAQLMTGIDYGGVQVTGLGFEASQGWGSVGYMTDLWDSYEDTQSEYSVSVTSESQAVPVFNLPYTPPVYTKINIYYSQAIKNSYISDGTTTIYSGSAFFNRFEVKSTITTEIKNVSVIATSMSTRTVNISGSRAVYNYFYGPTGNLKVGTPVQFIAGIINGLVANQYYYVKTIVDANIFTVSADIAGGIPGPVFIVTNTVYSASMNMRFGLNNSAISAPSAALTVGAPIRFTGNVFGPITANVTYYIKSILGDLSGFTITDSIKDGVLGNTIVLPTVTGSMTVNEILGSGYDLVYVKSTAGLKVGDEIQIGIAGAITPDTVISSINSSTQLTLSTIVYADIPNGTPVSFIRTLVNPDDFLFLTNTTIQLNEPVAAGAVIELSSLLDSVRIDDPNYNQLWTITNTFALGNVITAYEPINFIVGSSIIFSSSSIGGLLLDHTYYVKSVINNRQFTISETIGGDTVTVVDDSGSMFAQNIANTNAVMETYTSDGTSASIIIPQTFQLTVGDILTFRNSDSDGALINDNSNIDTILEGGNLLYGTATGLNPADILVDGDGFVTPTSSPAPEEVVPGQVVDAVAIKVFEKPTGGSAIIKVSSYIADGNTKSFVYGQYINNKQAIVVKLNGDILVNGFGIADTVAGGFVPGLKYTITEVGTTNFIALGASSNALGVKFVATGAGTYTPSCGKATIADYNVDYANKQVTFVVTPTAGSLITLDSFGFNGTNLVDLDYYIGDGTTTEFVTKANWTTNINVLVYLDGVPQTPQLFETDQTYENSGRIAVRFSSAPAANAVLNYLIVSGDQVTYSLIKTEKLPTNGTLKTFTLTNTVGASLPLESNIIVRVNQKILQGPTASYFTIASNTYKYTLDATNVQPFSINASQLEVYANGTLLTINKDYTVDVSGITIAINRATYRAFKGTRLAVKLVGSEDYTCTNNSITFGSAYASSDYVEVLSAYRHDILQIERSRTTASNNLTFTSDSPAFYKYTGILGGRITLQSSVIDDNYLWVIKNGTLLTASVDFKLNPDLISITLDKPLLLNDVVETIIFAGTPIVPGYSFMQFKDMLNRTVYKRLNALKQTQLAEDLNFYDSYIYVNDAGTIDRPNVELNRPGVIEIHGERIEFFTIDGNKLGQLRRGTLGTGTPVIHRVGTYVQDIGPSETIPYNDITNTYQTTVNKTTIDRIIPLSFTPMLVVDNDPTIDNWQLTGADFGIFDKATTNIVSAKTGTGPYYVTFPVPQMSIPPVAGKLLKVSGSYTTSFNGTFEVASSNTTALVTVTPTDEIITGTFGVVTVVDDGTADTFGIPYTATDDGGSAGTVYALNDIVLDGANASQNEGTIQGSVIYSFYIEPQAVAPQTGIFYNVTGTVPTPYNGSFLCTASTVNTITLVFPINYGQITTLPSSIKSTHTITLIYPTDPGIYSTLTPTTISTPIYGQSDDLDIFVGGYDNSTVWEPNTVYTAGQILSVNSYYYNITTHHKSGAKFNSPVIVENSAGKIVDTGPTVAASTVREFFIGNIRLKKHPYSVYNVEKAPDSPAGDIAFKADFAVDGINNEIILTNSLTAGTVVTIIKKTGTTWANDTGDIASSNTPLAKFIKAKPGIGYQGLPKISTVSPSVPGTGATGSGTFDNSSSSFDNNNITFDQGK
jgi:hypothetical protein